MSLITLTFGSGSQKRYYEENEFQRPVDMDFKQGDKGKVLVSKVQKFIGTDDLCVLGSLVSGMVAVSMTTFVGEKCAEVTEVESKYGFDKLLRKGTNVTLMLRGASKEDVQANDTLEFNAQFKEKKGPKKGKLIIC